MKKAPFLLFLPFVFAFIPGMSGCAAQEKAEVKAVIAIIEQSGIARDDAVTIIARMQKSPARFLELYRQAKALGASDPFLLRRVDKSALLPAGYEPADLVALDGSGLSLSRRGHRLRKPAYEALLAMDRAARKDGITLLISSTYRSHEYQGTVFARNVAESGRAEALRVSAPPGASQHQLGTAIDFGDITDAFASTPAGRWMARNAGNYGFSLSYPQGMEILTGYMWESWHYRYIGIPAVLLQNEFFGGVQQHLMQFLAAAAPAP
jgi:D-alanyl-D-alanine carboxypeptidase